MAEVLKIRSRAVTVYDYRNADITAFVKGFTADEEKYEKDLARMLKKHGTKCEAETVENGDTVTLTCVSELSRFNKTGIPVIVGRGVFDAAVEAELVGMNRGETKTVIKDGKEVTLTVSKIVHTVLPDLTDENVASFGLEGIATVRELRRSLIGRQIDSFLLEDENADMASAYVWQVTAANSVVERDPDELAHMQRSAEKRIAQIPAYSENEEDDALEEENGMSHEQLINMLVSELDLAAIGAGMMEQEGLFVPADDYTIYIDRLAEAYPDKTREELISEHTALDFVIERCANYLADRIDRYVAACFREVLTKDI